MMNNWFEVDKKGLKQVQSEKHKSFIVKELISNAFDEDITNCICNITLDNRSVTIFVEDDSPDGFKDLRDAYTLFAPSYKKGIAQKRGRFNIGEKLALAMFDEAFIRSTTGTISFDKRGTRKKSKTCSPFGTIFNGVIKNVKRSEFDEIILEAKKIIPPVGVKLQVNGEVITAPEIFKSFEEVLPSVTSDEEGNLVRTTRKTEIDLYKSDEPHIFELGIPVVSTDIGFSINVNQKIPLNKDRDNVSPAYAKKLKTFVLNHTSSYLSDEEAKASWVSEALENCDAEAVKNVVDSRYGEDATVYDMSFPEANKRAIADERNVITGGSFNKEVWNNIKKTREVYSDFAAPSSKYYPDPMAKLELRPDLVIPENEWTEGMAEVAALAKEMHQFLFDRKVHVTMFNDNSFSATYGWGDVTFYTKGLGKGWFDLKTNKEAIVDLIIHEFGHFYAGDHLSERYYRGLTKIGAKLCLTDKFM